MPTKTFNLSQGTIERLQKEKNQSKTVEDAVNRFLDGRDGAVALARLTNENTVALNEMAELTLKNQRVLMGIQSFLNRTAGANIRNDE